MLAILELLEGLFGAIEFIFRLIDGQTSRERARKQWWVMMLLVILTVALVSEGLEMIAPSEGESPRPYAGMSLAGVTLLVGTLLTIRWFRLAFLNRGDVEGPVPYARED